MANNYNPAEVEARWQEKWEETGLYRQVVDRSWPKHYALTMLPYPSGDLHIGHWYAMVPSDARARFMRMRGYNVLFPMGFDSFGLPAENAAIQRKIHPKTWTYANIERMRRQLRSMGAMFDWEREAVSSDPEYYKWSQWFFKKLMEQGLAYRKLAAVDFCPHCNTTLAREQVWGEDRHCERCKTPVIKKELEQWFFKTTAFAEELLEFGSIDWPERVKVMQTNWIGRSTGADVVFHTEQEDPIPIFTTRPDTLWGATFMVLAPEHPLVEKITSDEQRPVVEAYRQAAQRMSEIDREAADREKTGVFSGAYAINPVNGERIPIWVADYVLMSYGSGAIMAVPAHDERDFAFAQKYGLPIVEVIRMPGRSDDEGPLAAAYTSKTEGILVNSGPFTGTPVAGAVERVTQWLEEQGTGRAAVNYRLRDWLISRQRYWGAPIPVVYCSVHKAIPVPDEQLPVLLPEDVEFMPTGESPLKFHAGFLNTTCPECGRPALRETDTMDTFMCSSWYQYRYLSPHYDEGPFDPEEGEYWLPVDQYTGGIEHATMHLIYTRFFTKAMRDMGLVDFAEPMLALYNQGMVLGEDNEKMSKSRGNVVSPDELVRQYGADTVRTYLMFFAKWDQGGPWNYDGIKGPQRLLFDVWAIGRHAYAPPAMDEVASRALRRKTHQTIRRVTEDLESFSFNTAVAAIMELRNSIQDAQQAANVSRAAWDEAVAHLLLLLAPMAPHITEELWAGRGRPYSIHQQPWPAWDEEVAREEAITLVVQINGKVRDKITVPAGSDEETLRQTALASEKVRPWLDGKTPRKVIVVSGKLVNIVL
ncbi:MAG: leucine--tRNA ligase [Chloroflexi bacterium]|nr:leucine--tRNA ligase [Chloroflexota bacterium]MCI0575374.1 leucine--tRNA ligase [Chloroflexota bacterium]MCI0646378.1 leucine--tRNA ligase [Chloroflexota bacterium]MCI0728364.1 leucine--tRNA ligase [Chloroflexota bacterium]